LNASKSCPASEGSAARRSLFTTTVWATKS